MGYYGGVVVYVDSSLILRKFVTMSDLYPAPELITQKWLNGEQNITLESLRGKVVMVVAFQMLCPGCVEVSIPQAKNAFAAFSSDEVAVIGLHTVFEHHEAMREASLKAFLHEYRVEFPVAIDKPSGTDSPIPKTMELYRMRGTPTILLIDRQGYLRKQQFGHIPDLVLGAELMNLVLEEHTSIPKGNLKNKGDENGTCTTDGCS